MAFWVFKKGFSPLRVHFRIHLHTAFYFVFSDHFDFKVIRECFHVPFQADTCKQCANLKWNSNLVSSVTNPDWYSQLVFAVFRRKQGGGFSNTSPTWECTPQICRFTNAADQRQQNWSRFVVIKASPIYQYCGPVLSTDISYWPIHLYQHL